MNLFIIGAGGHAKVVLATLQAAGRVVSGIFDDDRSKQGQLILGVPVLGNVAQVRAVEGEVVAAIGDNRDRKKLVESLPGVAWTTAVHPSAVVHASVQVGEGTVIFAGTVVQPDTRLGAHVILNTGSTIDHDGNLDDFVHVAPGAHLAGNVHLREGCFVGVGSGIVPGRTVGAWSVVGAGGVVVRDIPDGATAVGVPARARPTKS